MADLTFFLVPYNQVTNVQGQLASFECSVVCSLNGIDFLRENIQRMQKEESSLFSVQGLVSQLAPAPISVLFNTATYLMASTSKEDNNDNNNTTLPNLSTTQDARDLFGNSRWERIQFLITKVDMVDTEGKSFEAAQNSIFYSLGVTLGRSLKFIEPPTQDRIRMVGLPEKQKIQNVRTGLLDEFKLELQKRAFDYNPNLKIIECLGEMIHQLQVELMKNKASNITGKIREIWSGDETFVHRICTRYNFSKMY